MHSEISEKSIGQFERKSFFLVLVLSGVGYVLVNAFFESPLLKQLSLPLLFSPFIYLILQYRKIKSDFWIKICLTWASFFILAKISYKIVGIIQSPSPYFLPVYFIVISILAIFLNSGKLFENLLKRRGNILALLLVIISLGLALWVFFHDYLPPSRFIDDSLNSAVDAPPFYYTGWYQTQTFYQGRISGWNDNFYGGYPTTLEVGRFGHGVTLFFLSLILSHFLSFPVIYKIHLLILYLLPIPALFLLTKEIFGKLEAGIASVLAFYILTAWVFNYKLMVSLNSILGWNALLFSFYFAYKYMRTSGKLYFGFMVLLASLSLVSHPISMILTLLTIPLILLFGPGGVERSFKRTTIRLLSFFLLVGFLVLPRYLGLIIYNDFLQGEQLRLAGSLLNLPYSLYSNFLFTLRGFGYLTNIFYFSLPIALLAFFVCKRKKRELSIWYILLVTFIVAQVIYPIIRVYFDLFDRAYLFLYLISVIPTSFGIRTLLANSKGMFTLVVATFLLFLSSHLMFPCVFPFLPHDELVEINSVGTFFDSYHQKDAVPSEQGRLMIEASTSQHDFKTRGGHVVPYLQLATNRELLSCVGVSPWAWHKYRYRCMKDGIFFGKDIAEWNIGEVEQIFRNYAVEYLVVYSEAARCFFKRYPERFTHIKDFKVEETTLSIFEFKDCEIDRTRIIGSGEASLISNTPHKKIIKVENADEGSRIILKYNYFPHWKAKIGEKKIKIDNWEGIMSVKPEKKGDYQITFYFPRFWEVDYGKLLNLIHL
ncbi:hypothetical protein E3J84_06860 [Candidatus Aerophobetes bacterium]|uniref:Uncharacterized protein n=1 Tax=Aerophobetes bacterium TaxID=2030807 RepID=A0A523RQ52_UNCAE|nr:MAG: hypothetical protein E3J84_06860 [Candidatus Aerophobetes bacterium]